MAVNHPVPQNRQETEDQTRYAAECAAEAARRRAEEEIAWRNRER